MYECVQCKADVSDFVSWNTCGDAFNCPECNCRLIVGVESYYDEDTGEDEYLIVEMGESE